MEPLAPIGKAETGTESAAKPAKRGQRRGGRGQRRFLENPPHLTNVDESSTVNVKSMSSADRSQCTADWTDEELILEYRVSRDQSLFSILVHRYERELYSYLRRYLGRADWAEDAFQATFLQLHLKCDQFQEGRRLKPWLYMIATNKAIDLQRRPGPGWKIERSGVTKLNGHRVHCTAIWIE